MPPRPLCTADLVRGLRKHGGRLMLNSHVERVLLDGRGRATGVALRGGGTITARKAVVSNASVWDTTRLLQGSAGEAAVAQLAREAQKTPACPSFMHLHVGFDATGGRCVGPRCVCRCCRLVLAATLDGC